MASAILLVSSLVAGSLALQSQIGAPAVQTAVPKESVSNGYESSRAIADFDRAIALKPDFRYAYINRANARLFRHPGLALSDFHRAGMHPERVLIAGAAVMLAVGVTVVKRRRSRTKRH